MFVDVARQFIHVFLLSASLTCLALYVADAPLPGLLTSLSFASFSCLLSNSLFIFLLDFNDRTVAVCRFSMLCIQIRYFMLVFCLSLFVFLSFTQVVISCG